MHSNGHSPSLLKCLLPFLLLHLTFSEKGTLGTGYSPQELAAAREIVLETHNIFRAWHNAPPMTLDPELNSEAQKAAEFLVTLKKIQHTFAGENIFSEWKSSHRPYNISEEVKKSVMTWYFEYCDTIKWPHHSGLNHFTQVVWSKSTKLGVGIAVNKGNHNIYIVGRYKPFGNIKWIKVNQLRCIDTQVCNGTKPKTMEVTMNQCVSAAVKRSISHLLWIFISIPAFFIM